MNKLDSVAIVLVAHCCGKRSAGESARRIGRNRHVEQLHLCGLSHARLCFLVSDHMVSGRVHAFVPVDMVNMPVGIDERMRRIGAHRGNCFTNVRNRRRKARINQDDAVFAGLNRHVAACALQQPDVVVKFRSLDRRCGAGRAHLRKPVCRRSRLRGLGKDPARCKRRRTNAHSQAQKTSAVDLKRHRDPQRQNVDSNENLP